MSPQAPQSISIGDLVRYYYEGWRHGHVVDIKPRKKQYRIKPCGPGRAVWASFANVEGIQ